MTEEDRAEREGELRHIASSFEGTCFSFLEECSWLCRLEREWKSVVGPVLGERSALVGYEEGAEGGIFHVSVTSPGALQDMNFKKGAILEALKRRISRPVMDIRFTLGRKRRSF